MHRATNIVRDVSIAIIIGSLIFCCYCIASSAARSPESAGRSSANAIAATP